MIKTIHIKLLLLFSLSIMFGHSVFAQTITDAVPSEQHVCVGADVNYTIFGFPGSTIKWHIETNYLSGEDVLVPDNASNVSHNGFDYNTGTLNYTWDGVTYTAGGFYMLQIEEVAEAPSVCSTGLLNPGLKVHVHLAPVIPSVVINQIACNGQQGSLDIDLSGITVPGSLVLQARLLKADNSISVDWASANTPTHTFSGLDADSYKIQIRYSVGGVYVKGSLVESLVNYDITEPTVLSLTSASVTSGVLCNGGDATVTLVASGGTGAMSYTFDGVTNASGIFTHAAGTSLAYSITDVNGCSALTGSLNITEPVTVSISLAETASIICNGDNAQVTITAGGGDGSYTYSSDDILYQASNIFNKPVGTHTLYVKDGNNCVAQDDITINEPIVILTNLTISTANICFEDAGIVTIENYEADVVYTLFEGASSLAYTSSVSGTDLVLTIDASILNTEKTYNIIIKAERGGCILDMDTEVSIEVIHKPVPGDINF